MFSSLKNILRPNRLSLQIGKTYMTLGDQEVLIIKQIDHTHPHWIYGYSFEDARGNTYRDDGRFCISSKNQDRRDIVREI